MSIAMKSVNASCGPETGPYAKRVCILAAQAETAETDSLISGSRIPHLEQTQFEFQAKSGFAAITCKLLENNLLFP